MEEEKLSSVVEVLESGARPKGGAVEFQADTIPSLGAEHLSDFGGFKFDKVKYIPKSFFNEMTKGIITRGDILVVKDGATTGKVSLVDNSFPFEKAAINEHVFLLRVNKTKAFNGYVFHFLKSPIGQIEIQKDFRGATVGGISRRFIDLIKLPFPPIQDQIRIANILSKAEALISQRKEGLRLLDEFLKSTFLEMFGDPVRNEKKLKQISLGELGAWKSGGTPSRGNASFFQGNIPWITSGELNQMYINDGKEKITLEAIEKSNASKIQAGSLLLGMYDTAALKSSISKTVVTCNQAIAFSKLDSKLCDTVFVYFTIQIGREYFRSQQRGVRQKNMNLSMIKGLRILYPPLNFQTQFAHIVEKAEALKAHYQTSLQELENLYGSLSQRAFKGELKFKEEELLQAAEPDMKYQKK